ncbi:3-phenylpropionate/cinnamic acid dioxygenase small subunit [Paraburkholderia sp. BL23I1N1]|uniref:aromatic-ring-hydroxylating dioxygenase subunit beta n=1 Tax=Paraburkholderia sp. BL23I1N1 TaxID=1938802 RepID=UPI000E749D56|nr:aromatic-ring-hydroxylating dioxygenase subunit beta [Paraburkholderia sp. BL23I1N1]RKE36126.1 3-phenylpropionate/cinnamic acid dioxygenase small subunit [Paraburkholderia sp. BL23I1N1]
MMDNRNTLFSQQTFAGAVELIWREAELLDRKDYREWLSLWDPAGFYVVPIDPDTTDFAATLNYAYDDQDMREKRVQRMTSGYSASASDAARTVRTVSRFTLTSDTSDEVEVSSAQIIVAYKRGKSTLFAADLTHRISFASGEARIVHKVIRLIDSTEALSAIGFLL